MQSLFRGLKFDKGQICLMRCENQGKARPSCAVGKVAPFLFFFTRRVSEQAKRAEGGCFFPFFPFFLRPGPPFFSPHSLFFSLSLPRGSEREREREKGTRVPNAKSMSGRPEPLAAKRPRSSRPGSASSGSGGKLGGGGGTADAAAKSQLRLGCRVDVGIGAKTHNVDSASTTPPALFVYSNMHDAIRAELRSLLRSVADASRAEPSRAEEGDVDVDVVGADDAAAANASALPLQTARARALADVATRARLLERVHAYHSAVEDEVKMDRNEGGERGMRGMRKN